MRNGEPIALTPKTFETLLVLVQNAGRPIARDELMQMVWPDSFVEEGNLTQNIFVLRKALGNGNRYIITIPGHGYQFAEKVREVEESPEAPAAESNHQPGAAGTQPASPARLSWALLLLAFLVLGGAGGLLLYRGLQAQSEIKATPGEPGAPTVPVRRSVAVLGFRNLSGRPADQWLSTAFAEMLNTELAAGDQLRLIPGEDVARVRLESKLPDADSLSKDSLQHLRLLLGSDLIVLGSYTALPEKDGERIRLDYRLQDARSGETLAEGSATGSRQQLFQLVTEAGAELRQKVGIAELSQAEAGQVRASLAANPEATRLFAQGLDKLRRFDALGARDLLQKAVAADPGYALFHSALAQSWAALGYDSKAETEAQRAFELSTHSSRREQLLVEGRYRELNHEYPAAIEIYRTLWNFFPDDLEYGLRLADVQIKGGLGKEALSTVARMRRLPEPENKDPRIDLAEAVAAESLSAYPRYLQAAAAAVAKARTSDTPLLLAEALRHQGYAYDRLGRPAQAINAYRQAQELWATAGDSYGAAVALHSIAVEQYYQGDFADSRQSFQGALQVFRRIGALWSVASCSHNFAMLLKDEGQLPQAKQALEEALRIQRELNDERGVAADLDDLGNVLFSMGDLPGAENVKLQAVQRFHYVENRMGEAIALGNLGEVLLAEGKLSQSNHTFEQALALKEQIGYKRGLAYSWSDLAEVLRAQDRLPQARALALQALRLRQELGDGFNIAQSQLQLAKIALEQGNAAEAESQARSATAVFDKRKVADSGAIAYAVLSRALLGENKKKEAEAASNQALVLSQKGGDREAGFQALLAGAAVKMAVGRTAEAQQMLESLRSQSARYGYFTYELESRLRLGALELKSGQRTGDEQLRRVQQEAQGKGFLLIARQAGLALNRGASIP